MDLIAVGSGRPALVQEIAGPGGAALGPLVSLNLLATQSMPDSDLYKAALASAANADELLEMLDKRRVVAQEAAGAVIEEWRAEYADTCALNGLDAMPGVCPTTPRTRPRRRRAVAEQELIQRICEAASGPRISG